MYITLHHHCTHRHSTQGLYIVDDKHLWIELKLKSDNQLGTYFIIASSEYNKLYNIRKYKLTQDFKTPQASSIN